MNKSLWSGMLFVPDNALIGYPNVGQRWGCCPTYFGFSNTSRCLTLKKPPALFTGPGGFFMNKSLWSGTLFVPDNALIGYPNVGQRWGCCPTYHHYHYFFAAIVL